jgi:hypothetical protein
MNALKSESPAMKVFMAKSNREAARRDAKVSVV